jgi:hypothetical protein
MLSSVLFAATLSLVAPVTAAERQSANQGLPGVESGYRIVNPAPEPDDAAPANERKGGRWDVTISGTITIDVSNGKLPPPER